MISIAEYLRERLEEDGFKKDSNVFYKYINVSSEEEFEIQGKKYNRILEISIENSINKIMTKFKKEKIIKTWVVKYTKVFYIPNGEYGVLSISWVENDDELYCSSFLVVN